MFYQLTKNEIDLALFIQLLTNMFTEKELGEWNEGSCKPTKDSRCGKRKMTRTCKGGTFDPCEEYDKEQYIPCSDDSKGLSECGKYAL